MVDVEAGLFTVAVFQDVAWAQKGLDALKQSGFAPESLTIIAKSRHNSLAGFAGLATTAVSNGPSTTSTIVSKAKRLKPPVRLEKGLMPCSL